MIAPAGTSRMVGLGVAVLGVAVSPTVLGLPTTAYGHVTVQPGEIQGGGYSVVAFRVPNERDDASTSEVTVRLPVEEPIASVRTTPVPGWQVAIEQRTLAEPIELHGEPVEEVVESVTWTATGDGIQPGQYQDFELSLGPLPESGELALPAVQRYSSGEEVAWDEVAVAEGVELEHPAPVLSLTGPADADGDDDQGGDDTALPTSLAAAALVVSLAALASSLVRRRRP